MSWQGSSGVYYLDVAFEANKKVPLGGTV